MVWLLNDPISIAHSPIKSEQNFHVILALKFCDMVYRLKGGWSSFKARPLLGIFSVGNSQYSMRESQIWVAVIETGGQHVDA